MVVFAEPALPVLMLLALLAGPRPSLALPLPDGAVADERAWDWWEQPPYLSWTEEEPPPEPPLILLEDEPWKGGRAATATARASPRPRPDTAIMDAVEDWTPRMKREYLREQQREHVDQLMREREELQRKADAALERIGYWDMLKFGIDTVAGFGGLKPLPLPSPSPTPVPSSVYTELGIDASWAVPLGNGAYSWGLGEPPYEYDYDAEPGYEDVYPREPRDDYDLDPGWGERPQVPRLGEPPYDDYKPEQDAYHFLEWS